MTDVDGDEGFLADPETIIAAAVAIVEPHLGDATIHNAINQAASTRAQRRRLAIALTAVPELLTSGQPQGPPQIESLISALRATGAQRVTPPRCAQCGRAVHLRHSDGDLRICAGCDRRRRSEPCVGCGAIASVATRDDDGRPRCTHCRPRNQPDSTGQITSHITSLDPGLNHAALQKLICDTVPQAFQRRRVARELEQNPSAADRSGGQRLAAPERPRPRPAGSRRPERRRSGLPILRPHGGVEVPDRRGPLLSPLLRPDTA
jgi:hypothetical protein